MRKLLIPRTPFGFIVRIALLYWVLAAVTYAVHLALQSATILLVLHHHHLTHCVEDLVALWSAA